MQIRRSRALAAFHFACEGQELCSVLVGQIDQRVVRPYNQLRRDEATFCVAVGPVRS